MLLFGHFFDNFFWQFLTFVMLNVLTFVMLRSHFYSKKYSEKMKFGREETENWSLENGPTIKKKILSTYFF